LPRDRDDGKQAPIRKDARRVRAGFHPANSAAELVVGFDRFSGCVQILEKDTRHVA